MVSPCSGILLSNEKQTRNTYNNVRALGNMLGEKKADTKELLYDPAYV